MTLEVMLRDQSSSQSGMKEKLHPGGRAKAVWVLAHHTYSVKNQISWNCLFWLTLLPPPTPFNFPNSLSGIWTQTDSLWKKEDMVTHVLQMKWKGNMTFLEINDILLIPPWKKSNKARKDGEDILYILFEDIL